MSSQSKAHFLHKQNTGEMPTPSLGRLDVANIDLQRAFELLLVLRAEVSHPFAGPSFNGSTGLTLTDL